MKCPECGRLMELYNPFGRANYFFICRECLTIRCCQPQELKVTIIGE